jgi:DNA-binding CsgD family transcriptional regulator
VEHRNTMDSLFNELSTSAALEARAGAFPIVVRPPVAAPAATPFVTRHELEFLLDRVTAGLVAVDAAGRVLHANRAARELMAQLRGGAGAPGRLAFPDPATQAALQRALAACGEARADDTGDAARDPDDPAVAVQFLVRDRAGAILARASVEPLRRAAAPGGGRRAFLVSLHRQPGGVEIRQAALSALYGLTRSEARIAAAVVAARSIDDLARRVTLSRNTVKSHLKRVFRKCEVASLAQLAALVATGPRLR